MIDFSVVLTDHNDKPIMLEGEELTLRAVIVRALVLPYEDERNLAWDEKFKRGELASRVHRAKGPFPLKAEQVTLLKKLIGQAFGPMIVFQVAPLLDPAEVT